MWYNYHYSIFPKMDSVKFFTTVLKKGNPGIITFFFSLVDSYVLEITWKYAVWVHQKV